MKYAIIAYIALGCVLSVSFGIVYRCEGQEVFPVFYGSPFVFKRTSLGSSMEYFYSISGLLLNVLVWGVCLFALDKWIHARVSKLAAPRWMSNTYKLLIGLMLFFSTVHIGIHAVILGRGFGTNTNYWFWNMDKEAKDWGMACKGEWILFNK
jgi:hypothetical protein